MRKIQLFFWVAALALGLSFGYSAPAQAEEEAVQAARAWLALVDAGEYGKSWDASAALVKKAVTKEQWEQSLKDT